MRGRYLVLHVVLICLLCVVTGYAQPVAVSERAAEWSRLSLPTAEFVRIINEANGVVFRAPADWPRQEVATASEQQPTFRFAGPHSSLLQISVEKIPDGLRLSSYVAAILQQLRNLPGSAGPLVRRTEMSGFEAREITFEVPVENGAPSRRVIWCTVSGPVAAVVLLIEPTQHSPEIEPYLRAVVQSLTISGKEKLASFEALRATAIKQTNPVRVDAVQSFAGSFDGLNATERDVVVAKLAALFVTAPEVAIDLLLDRRPVVRAAVVEGLARSKNRVLDPFLVKALHDQELTVAERAGRAVAAMPHAVALLHDETVSWMSTELLARVWPFLNKNLRLQILNEAFGAQTRPIQRTAKSRAVPTPPVTNYAQDSSTQLGLLTLLVDLPVQDFGLPLAEVLKSNNDVLTATALQVAYARGEKLPATDLLKLLSSTSTEVQRLAARNLGESATSANVAQIEEASKKIAAQLNSNPQKTPTTNADDAAAKANGPAAELQTTIKKIRLREQLSAANQDQRQQFIKSALADPQLADWAWLRFADNDAKVPDWVSNVTKPPQLSFRAEYAFPEQMTHYVTIPKPADLFGKLGESLNNIQMDSARAQANLVLVLNGVHRQLGLEFGAPAGGSILEYLGLNPTAPISFGSWSATGAPLGIASAQRKAIVLRVGDRDRFERTLALYQDKIGSFAALPDGVAIGARFLGAVPAILPLTADMLLQDKPRKKTETPILKYAMVGQTEIEGYAVKYFAQRRVSEKGGLTNDVAYLVYAGDAALLAPDLVSLRDVLHRIKNGGPVLEKSAQYKAALGSGGDAIYFSTLSELFAEPGARSDSQTREYGSLRISNNYWESSYQLTSDDASQSQFLFSFQPDQLLAPRDLLPRSTVLYYFMKMSGPEALREWNRVATPQHQKDLAALWSLDFEKQVLAEIDQECGAAMLALPDVNAEVFSAPWIIFFKLKSGRLQQALNDGRLFKDATTSKGLAKIKFGASELFITASNGFLVVSDAQGTFERLNEKEKLAASPDFIKAVKRTPAGIVAFGGYNLEATAPKSGGSSDSIQMQQANLILSLVRAFHSPSLYATVNAGRFEARSSISLDREGRYSVAELQALAAKSEPTFAVLEPSGIPISNQDRLKNLRLRIRAKTAGAAERIAEDVFSDVQTVEKQTEQELLLQVLPRRSEPAQKLQLPINGNEFASDLKPTADIRSDDKSVIDKAREIAGADRDAWTVARKLADWTHENLTWKVVDNADAAQTLATREADCYEFSKLYVAMARSLGLPARIVSGMAYSGSAFGGHAWVEVYAGRWLELDPTWGTTFVDATHIKTSNGALLSYAALDLVQLEVLEAPRSVAEFQLNPTALARKLCEDLSEGKSDVLESALDVALVTDDLMGAGTWAAMSDKERDQISSPYRRILSAIVLEFRKTKAMGGGVRLLKVNIDGSRAEALAMHSLDFGEVLLKMSLVRHGEAWMLREIEEVDTGLRMVAENLQPTIHEIRGRRSGNPSGAMFQTEFARVLTLADQNAPAGLELVERLLKNNPKDAGLRYLKSLMLMILEKDDEAAKIWVELSEEQPLFAQALRKLAEHYEISEEESDRKKAIDLYNRYLSLEPDDPRARSGLANLYELGGDLTRAEAEYRAAVEGDSSNATLFIDLAEFYATRRRFAEAVAVLDEAAKRAADKQDLLANLLSRYWLSEQTDIPEELAARQPQPMAQSARANIVLARMRINHQRSREALPLLKKAAALDAKLSEPYNLMSEAHRSLREWSLALAAAEKAIRLNAQDGDAHYERACSLARLGRIREAINALKRAIELDEDLSLSLEDEGDLKALSNMPEFKKLLPKPEQP